MFLANQIYQNNNPRSLKPIKRSNPQNIYALIESDDYKYMDEKSWQGKNYDFLLIYLTFFKGLSRNEKCKMAPLQYKSNPVQVESSVPRSLSIQGSTLNIDICTLNDKSIDSERSAKDLVKISVLPKPSDFSELKSNSKLSTLRESRNDNSAMFHLTKTPGLKILFMFINKLPYRLRSSNLERAMTL